jgi:hypothetical protein
MIVDYVRVYQSTSIGVEENSVEQSRFCPNPTDGTARIKHNAHNATLVIYDNTGEKLLEIDNYKSDVQFDLSHLASGVYTYTLENNRDIIQNSFVKQ